MPERSMIYAGYLRPGETSLQRLRAFEMLGCSVTPVNMLFTQKAGFKRLVYRISAFLFRKGFRVWMPDFMGTNVRLKELARSGSHFEWLWLDKPLAVHPGTLAEVRRCQPGIRIVAFAPDDMAARHNQSRQLLESLPLLDAFVTTKSYNVSELQDLGCPRVVFMDNGYDPETHHPVPVSPELRARYGGPVGFIGSYERERALSLLHLAQNGIQVRVWGGTNWRLCPFSHPNLILEYKELVGTEYAAAICAFDINLSFLRKLNRDMQTTRTIEIPACGAFMLAEGSDEQKRLFEDGREAVFFSGNDDLLEKVRYYVRNESERQAIAEAGRLRCVTQGYDYASRLKKVLDAWETCSG